MQVLNSVRRFIFGYDIFISYSRKDSLDYAYSIAKHFMKEEFGYDCYIDQLSSTTPGKSLPKDIVSALQRSTAFIIIGSEGAMHSQAITEEVSSFKQIKTNNPIIPIDIDGNIFTATWYPDIQGLAIIQESNENFRNKQPSADILERIHNSLTFTKKSQKLRRTAIGFLIFFILLIAATLFMFKQVSSAQKELATTRKQNRYEQLTALVYQSKNSADSNSITGLQQALKAYTDYRDVDSSNLAEKNLLDLFNNSDIVIRTQFSTGARLSPGGKYIYDGRISHISSQKELFGEGIVDCSFSPDDELVAITGEKQVKLYHISDRKLIDSFAVKDSTLYVTFDPGNHYIFLTTIDALNSFPGKNRVQVIDRINYATVANVQVPSAFEPTGYLPENGGYLILTSLDKTRYDWALIQVSTDSMITKSYSRVDSIIQTYQFLTSDHLILDQSVSKVAVNSALTANRFHYNTRLMQPDGKVIADSSFIYLDFLQSANKDLFHSNFNNQFVFGLYGAFTDKLLLNTGNRPFSSPDKFRLGMGLPPDYRFIKLISEQLILAVAQENDEYRVTVFRITGKDVQQVFSVLNKNHPNGSVGDDAFMKWIHISYCASTNFLAIYDSGLGNCTQYYLDKQPIKSAAELQARILQKAFGEVWEH